MASERDLELLDDYISNRLGGAEKTAFEERLQQDPDLKAEYTIQQQIAAGIRQARAAELKQMLNSIPVPPVSGTGLSAAKIAGLAIVALLGLTLIYYVTRQTPEAIPAKTEQPVSSSAPETQPADQNTPPIQEPETAEPAPEEEPSKPAESEASAPAREPDAQKRLDVFDPSGEAEPAGNEPIPGAESASEESTVLRKDLAVVTDGTNKKYKFHYQVLSDKVVLYGTFEKNLYQILEFISGEKRTIFLYYKETYYLLDPSGSRINPLVPVTDPALLKKLRESVKQN